MIVNKDVERIWLLIKMQREHDVYIYNFRCFWCHNNQSDKNWFCWKMLIGGYITRVLNCIIMYHVRLRYDQWKLSLNTSENCRAVVSYIDTSVLFSLSAVPRCFNRAKSSWFRFNAGTGGLESMPHLYLYRSRNLRTALRGTTNTRRSFRGRHKQCGTNNLFGTGERRRSCDTAIIGVMTRDSTYTAI